MKNLENRQRSLSRQRRKNLLRFNENQKKSLIVNKDNILVGGPSEGHAPNVEASEGHAPNVEASEGNPGSNSKRESTIQIFEASKTVKPESSLFELLNSRNSALDK